MLKQNKKLMVNIKSRWKYGLLLDVLRMSSMFFVNVKPYVVKK